MTIFISIVLTPPPFFFYTAKFIRFTNIGPHPHPSGSGEVQQFSFTTLHGEMGTWGMGGRGGVLLKIEKRAWWVRSPLGPAGPRWRSGAQWRWPVRGGHTVTPPSGRSMRWFPDRIWKNPTRHTQSHNAYTRLYIYYFLVITIIPVYTALTTSQVWLGSLYQQ